MFRILAQGVTDVNILDVITKVDSLYSNAYNRLFLLFAGGFALVGVLTPLFIQLIQQRSLNEEKNSILTQTNKEIKQLKRKFEKALASDSAIHFLEHAKNLPGNDNYNIDAFCLTLLSAKQFAKAENISGIHLCFDAINVLQLPKVSFGKDIEKEHSRLLSRYDMAYTAIKESGFEKDFTTQLKSIKTKIEEWYGHLKDKQG
ncbi:MAG: hypothetical protein KAI59_05380 [Planctomycetes bacterium]|nr:hypothetical protein [Planctomycetota bacterium]MCK5473444.1 hypothetical protein [Planctomycetota bacterium]